MIKNIKYDKDLITLDKSLNQIRYCKDIKNCGEIKFLNIPSYKWSELIPDFNDKPKFLKECVKEFIDYELNLNLDIKKMRVFK